MEESPFHTAFKRLIARDKKLVAAIHRCKLVLNNSRLSAVITINPGIDEKGCSHFDQVSRKVYKIARFALMLGNFDRLILQGSSPEDGTSEENSPPMLIFEMVRLIAACPAIVHHSPGVFDRALLMQQSLRESRLCRTMIDILAEQQSVFVVSTSGIYLHCRIHKGSVSKIAIEEMEGKPLDEVLPLETAIYLLHHIQECYATDEERDVEYSIGYSDGEKRSYKAKLIPSPGTESVLLLVKRVLAAKPH